MAWRTNNGEFAVPPPRKERIQLVINGKRHTFAVEPRTTLMDILRERLKYTTTKEGCGVGECGSCAVGMNGRMGNSCVMLAVDLDGANIVTLEGMATEHGPQPVQESFIDHLALQARAGDAPPAERREVLTFCHICAGHCAVRGTAAGGTIVDMAPDLGSGFPHEQGGGRKGRMSIPETPGHRARLLYPMKRVGERGEGKWQRIGWDDA